MSETTARIRELNDAFRSRLVGGKVYLTAGVDALPDDLKRQVLESVKAFDRFSSNNDPHGEHDFGSFTLDGRTLFWKIDYYDATLTAASEDPSDPTQTTRVLTIMLADEY